MSRQCHEPIFFFLINGQNRHITTNNKKVRYIRVHSDEWSVYNLTNFKNKEGCIH